MKILVVSNEGDSGYLWLRLVSEGHELKVYIKDAESRKEIMEGLVDKVQAWQPWVNWCDFVIFDHNSLQDIWKSVVDRKPCFGGSELGHALEKDRELGHQVMEYVGLPKLESETYKTIKEVREHLKSHKVLHVVKPFGKKVSSQDIIISEDEDGEDAIALLHRFEARRIPFDGIEVEERKLGVEVAVGGFFNGQDWVPPFEVNFEHKRFATGKPEGLGFLTGEMGTAMRYTRDPKNKCVQLLQKMTKVLREGDYRGQIDINMLADEKNIWPLEFTTRMGYPALALNMSLQETPIGELLYGLACGHKMENKVKDLWSIGVVVVSYGFPFRDEVKEKSTEYPVFNLSEDNIEHINLCEVKVGFHDKDVPGLVTSEGDGYPLVVTGTGKTLQEAQKDAYRYLNPGNEDRVRIPNTYWRTDIGDRVIAQRQKIIDYGILTKEEFDGDDKVSPVRKSGELGRPV